MKIKSIVVEPFDKLPWITEEQAILAIGNAAGITHGKDDDELEACKKRALYCIKKGHHSVLEHINLSVWCIVDRGTSHALVRHRHCAFTQESSLYTKYAAGIEVIELPQVDPITCRRVPQYELSTLLDSEATYQKLLTEGLPNVIARDVLTNALATRLVITTNLREWFHILKVRKSKADSVRMHVFAYQLEQLLTKQFPTITPLMLAWKGEVE